ncbi:hypothetical protein L228DRAFT_245815 [Xylona heveae TC161]|uniref:Arrestin C-terminal-like domain-containing protein n=1 Tax=Xylona heveae (strain CBS 132557 / TC161) TaxID=1328760 RepID=A0A161TQX5_XYLHT|nr:hypothetical protein L228DRAFT_245815 [Xylona heveae TC161]KZF24796.1 hypothetical protein L228DRAFT_245815 [Xylona heveae TC161]
MYLGSASPLPRDSSFQGRSILTRLASTFTSKTRTLVDFHIATEEPHRQYNPGDIVKGTVALTVIKPVRITHLVVCLHGYAKVFKNAITPGHSTGNDYGYLGAGRSKKGVEYVNNGFASLFEDEIVLCGEGRLDVGLYEFKFELQFPKRSLPTSLDFERGTITYNIVATLTRPTALAPTISCDRKVYLVDSIDIAPIKQPKPRVISLEPISRRSKTRSSLRKGSSRAAKGKQRSTSTADLGPGQESGTSSLSQSDRTSQTASPSELDSESTVSNSTRSSVPGLPPSSGKTTKSNGGSSVLEKTITATMELLQGGCLRGDLLPVRITINHTKPVKSLHGVIITLYRQGRIDPQPDTPLVFSGKEADKVKHDEYFPKSKTGLGGLSLSSANYSSVFRKDLSQTFAPLIVDPRTLTAVIKASVRVPEDAFPTISVPGGIMSFKYYIEVVLDLGGKLAGQERFMPPLGMIGVPLGTGGSSPGLSRAEDTTGGALAAWAGSIVDTDHIRREKSVVSCLFEVVVGTKDTERHKKKREAARQRQWEEQTSANHPGDNSDGRRDGEEGFDWEMPGRTSSQDGVVETIADSHSHQQTPPPLDVPQSDPNEVSVPTPIPAEFEDGLDEKERMRRAEARLLPSQPSDFDERAGAPHQDVEPSAPDMFHHPDIRPFEQYNFSEDDYFAGPSMPPVSLDEMHPPHEEPFSAPGYDEYAQATTPTATDDKHEIERRRLQAEASAPDDFPDDESGSGNGADDRAANEERSRQMEPSAPVLPEDSDYMFGANSDNGHSHGRYGEPGDNLPRYER